MNNQALEFLKKIQYSVKIFQIFMSETFSEDQKNEGSEEKKYPVKRVCGWCPKDMGLADWESPEPGKVTHGLCEECSKKLLADLEKK